MRVDMNRGRVSEKVQILFLCALIQFFLPGPSAAAEPLPEATMMRQVILNGFPRAVDFQPFDRAVFTARVLELAAHPGDTAVVGGVQEDFLALYRSGALASVEGVLQKLASRAFLPRFSGRGVSGRSEELIDYLTRPDVQVKTMEGVGFLPVVRISNRVDLPDGLRVLLQAAVAQLSSPEAILSSVPLLGGDACRSFNLAYMVAFSRIVLRGLPIDAVLAVQERKLLEAVTPIRMSPSELRGH